MSIVAGGSNGITFPNGSNTPAGSVTAQFSPNITDTSNTMTIASCKGSVAFCGTNGVVINKSTTSCGGFAVTISTNVTTPYCVRAQAVSAGWCQSAKLLVFVNSGVIVSSNTTSSAAMTFTGSFPNGALLINKGTIVGMGGVGGGTGSFGTGRPSNGFAGGNAVKTTVTLTICNAVGVIAGGGGGGASAYYCCCGASCLGGGGGRTGLTNARGGYSSYGCTNAQGFAGTFTTPGCGGIGGGGYRGGGGGCWGSAGGNTSYSRGSYSGGAGGKSVCGTVTFKKTGTLYG